jgi:hypothetical protein
MNQILPDVVVLSVPALTVQQLPVIHPRRNKNCLSKEETLQCLNPQITKLATDQNMNEV